MLIDLLDKDGGPPHANRKSKEHLRFYTEFFNLTDIFLITNPKKKVYTIPISALYSNKDRFF